MGADYAVKVSVRNGRILSRMKALGIESQAELARRAGIPATTLNAIICLRTPPLGRRGQWIDGVEDVAGALGCDPEDLFTERQLTLAVKTNSSEVYMDEPTVAALASGDMETSAWASIEAQRLLEAVPTKRARDVVMRRAEGETYDEIAADYRVGRERIRQIEMKALRQMKARAARNDGEVSNMVRFGSGGL
jgi:transcriptional regulator with XRE-family HTH domain